MSTSSTACSTSSTSRSRRTPPASRCSAQPTAKAGQLFLNDELSHAGDLAGLVREAGGKPIKPAPSYALGHPRNSEEVLMLLHQIEQAQIAAYLNAIPRLEPGHRQAAGGLDPRQRRAARRGRAGRARAAGDPVGVRDRAGVSFMSAPVHPTRDRGGRGGRRRGAVRSLSALATVADPAAADTPPLTDAQALSNALDDRAADRARLPAGARRRARSKPTSNAPIAPYLGHEVEHVNAVAARLEAMGVSAPTAPLTCRREPRLALQAQHSQQPHRPALAE